MRKRSKKSKLLLLAFVGIAVLAVGLTFYGKWVSNGSVRVIQPLTTNQTSSTTDTSALISPDLATRQQFATHLVGQLNMGNRHLTDIAALGTVSSVKGDLVTVQKFTPDVTTSSNEEAFNAQIYPSIGSVGGTVTAQIKSSTHFIGAHTTQDLHPGDEVLVGGAATSGTLQAVVVADFANTKVQTSSAQIIPSLTANNAVTGQSTYATNANITTASATTSSPLSEVDANLHYNGQWGLNGFNANAAVEVGNSEADGCTIGANTEIIADLHTELHWLFKMSNAGKDQLAAQGVDRTDTTSVNFGSVHGNVALQEAENTTLYTGFGAGFGTTLEAKCKWQQGTFSGGLDALGIPILAVSNHTFKHAPLVGESPLDIPHDVCISGGLGLKKGGGSAEGEGKATSIEPSLTFSVCPKLTLEPAPIQATATYSNGHQQQLEFGNKPLAIDQSIAAGSTSVTLSHISFSPTLTPQADVSLTASASGDLLLGLVKQGGKVGVTKTIDLNKFVLSPPSNESSIKLSLLPTTLLVATSKGTINFDDVTVDKCVASRNPTTETRSGFASLLTGYYQGQPYTIMAGGDVNGSTLDTTYPLVNPDNPQPQTQAGIGSAVGIPGGSSLYIGHNIPNLPIRQAVRTTSGNMVLKQEGGVNDYTVTINGQVSIINMPSFPATGTVSGQWHCESPQIID